MNSQLRVRGMPRDGHGLNRILGLCVGIGIHHSGQSHETLHRFVSALDRRHLLLKSTVMVGKLLLHMDVQRGAGIQVAAVSLGLISHIERLVNLKVVTIFHLDRGII